MSFVQLQAPSEFADRIEKHWSDRDAAGVVFVPANRIVSGVADFYEIDGGPSITVNDDGPVVRRRQCADTDFDCNFWDGDAILVASDPKPSQEASEAPIRLLFSSGVRAVGAWLAVSPRTVDDDDTFPGQPLLGFMWVRLASDPAAWQPFLLAQGETGTSLNRGDGLTAPFVAARVVGNDRILEARFDAGLMGNRVYARLAVSELTLTL
jgi:hypothetical protein